MATVFKYCDAHGVGILEDLELKVTPPNQFNDPFEFTPHVICSSPKREVKRIFKNKDELREMFQEDKATGRFTGTFRQFKELMRKARPALIAAVVPHMPERSARFQQNYLDHTSGYCGVLCMSARRDSILMWGHYCDKHRGIVIGLDSSWKPFQDMKGLRPVNYGRKRVVWDSSWEPGEPNESAFMERLILWKNDEWKYEDELRQLYMLHGLHRKPLDNGTTGYFLRIPAAVLTSVSLGARCAAELERKVRSALRNPLLSHVKLDRAVLHESEFLLRFE